MSEQEICKHRCIQYLTREYTEEERITFEIDLLFNEELKKSYDNYSLLWKAYPTNKEIWKKSKQEQKQEKISKKLFSTKKIQIACVFLVLISCFEMAYLLISSVKDPLNSEYQIYSNAPGVRKKIMLEDGSVVILNGKSRLQYTQNDSTRLAWLEGEGYFDIVKNVHKKFIVKHEDLAIEVVGTQFSVNTIEQQKKITLLSGKVLAKIGNGEQLYLKPNEQLIWDPTLGEIKRFKTNVDQQISWRDEKLIFNNTPLSQALIQINQFYGVTFIVKDLYLAQNCITGVFDHTTLDEFIEVLAFIANCTITLNNNNYLIEPHV